MSKACQIMLPYHSLQNERMAVKTMGSRTIAPNNCRQPNSNPNRAVKNRNFSRPYVLSHEPNMGEKRENRLSMIIG